MDGMTDYASSVRREGTDNAIIGRIMQMIRESPNISIDNVRVDCIDGTVNISGTVKTLHEKSVAAALASSVPGVASVETDLVVTGGQRDTDEDLLEAVSEALGDFPQDQPVKIGVRTVCNGTAYIVGKAVSAMQAKKAEIIAESVPGVKAVVNEIVIAPGSPVDDTSLANSVLEALNRDPRADAVFIDVDVVDATVYLMGAVDNDAAIRIAEELATSVPGVKGVVNRLSSRKPGHMTSI